MPKRREVIVAVLGGSLSAIAGCTSSSSDGEDTSSGSTSTSTGTTSPTSEQADTTAAQSISKDDLSFTGEIIQEGGETTPPEISLSLRNKSSQKVRLTNQLTPPFSNYWSDDGSDLVLLPDDREYIRPSNPEVNNSGEGCWSLNQEIKVESIGIHGSLNPSESVTEGYTLVNNVSSDGCAEDSSYSFTDEIEVHDRAFSAEVAVQIENHRLLSISTMIG